VDRSRFEALPQARHEGRLLPLGGRGRPAQEVDDPSNVCPPLAKDGRIRARPKLLGGLLTEFQMPFLRDEEGVRNDDRVPGCHELNRAVPSTAAG
jgi:hypothetical protein